MDVKLKISPKEKNLIIKDLACRLPYKPKVRVYDKFGDYKDYTIDNIDLKRHNKYVMWCHNRREIGKNENNIRLSGRGFSVDNVRPYLRPLSSMSRDEFKVLLNLGSTKSGSIENVCMFTEIANYEQIMWFIENFFDYRDLIEKGLAIEAPKKMYKKAKKPQSCHMKS